MTLRADKILTAVAFLLVLVTAFVDLWLALIVGAVLLVVSGVWERLALRRLAHR